MKDKIIAAVVIGSVLTFISFAIGLSLSEGYRRSQCIKYGYPESDTHMFDVYCIRLVNNTHEVINLIELQNEQER